MLLLVVGLLGLIFSIKGRSKGVSGLMVGAFVVMIVTTAAGIVWQFVLLNVPSWSTSNDLSFDEIRWIFMGVGIPLDAAAVLSWLLVAIAVVKAGRPPRRPGFAPHPGPADYPTAAQPGFLSHPPTQQPPS
ncbi:hypothetical protein [Amycolatopsis sp. cmx-11-32]|uniref:hypothetical protein n=1 Tax=Amycolatopsis sp. cmx-11-32 TaxID=2785796 RepID=UPI0039E421F4